MMLLQMGQMSADNSDFSNAINDEIQDYEVLVTQELHLDATTLQGDIFTCDCVLHSFYSAAAAAKWAAILSLIACLRSA